MILAIEKTRGAQTSSFDEGVATSPRDGARAGSGLAWTGEMLTSADILDFLE